MLLRKCYLESRVLLSNKVAQQNTTHGLYNERNIVLMLFQELPNTCCWSLWLATMCDTYMTFCGSSVETKSKQNKLSPAELKEKQWRKKQLSKKVVKRNFSM